jgi:hypothetical protein
LGGAGNDLVYDGPNREFSTDILSAGDGNDVIGVFNDLAFKDLVSCGGGFDAGEDSASTLTGRLRRVRSFMEKVNHPVQGTGADGLKLATALFNEQLPEHLDAKLIIACHDELVVECPEEQAEETARFLEEAMVAGMNEVVNPGLDADHPYCVPVEVEAEIVGSWGG